MFCPWVGSGYFCRRHFFENSSEDTLSSGETPTSFTKHKRKQGKSQRDRRQAKKNKTKNFRCLGGDAGGATYDGHAYDEYYYKNKMFGNQKIKESDNTSN